MPKGGGSKTPQLEDFPLNTDMVEKQGGKKVRKIACISSHTLSLSAGITSNNLSKLLSSNPLNEVYPKSCRKSYMHIAAFVCSLQHSNKLRMDIFFLIFKHFSCIYSQ